MKCFVSYSWDSEDHKSWVRYLAGELRRNGVDTSIDQWDAFPGIDLTNFMESNIRESNYVLMVCTPAYAAKANNLQGGVGYEKTIITGEIFQSVATPGKFVPLLKAGSPNNSLPSFLMSAYFIDFRVEDDFAVSLEILLRHIYSQPEHVKPSLGDRPSFGSNAATLHAVERNQPKKLSSGLELFQAAFQFAYSSSGMNYTTDGARRFAENWVSKYADKNFESFKAAFQFAYGSSGMNYTTDGARQFAESWVTNYAQKNFEDYKKAFQFAYSSSGMNYTTDAARQFALSQI